MFSCYAILGKEAESIAMDYKHIIQLKSEFESLGFDLGKVEMEDPFPNRTDLFQLSTSIPINDPKVPGDFFSAFFTGRIVNEQRPVIDQIHAALLSDAPNGSTQIIVSDSFERVNGVLATKDQIFERLLTILRNKNIHTKFGMDKDDSKDSKQNDIKRRNRF